MFCVSNSYPNFTAIKPFSGFGWIETGRIRVFQIVVFNTIKPFSGFGWIETRFQG